MTISDEVLDRLLKGCKRPEDLPGDAGLRKELKVRLMERMLGAELTAHLGSGSDAKPQAEPPNRRNGVATKRVKGLDGEVPLSVPRNREGSFEPEPVKKDQTRIDGADDKSEPACHHRFETAGERSLRRRADRARHSGLSGGSLWPAGLPRPDQPRHRCRAGRGPGMAAPGAGWDLSHCDLRVGTH
jgi:hypothetical protein